MLAKTDGHLTRPDRRPRNGIEKRANARKHLADFVERDSAHGKPEPSGVAPNSECLERNDSYAGLLEKQNTDVIIRLELLPVDRTTVQSKAGREVDSALRIDGRHRITVPLQILKTFVQGSQTLPQSRVHVHPKLGYRLRIVQESRDPHLLGSRCPRTRVRKQIANPRADRRRHEHPAHP